MSNRRDLTKELLAGCFKELMKTRAFEKITIKNITDKAGLIRPTFYKHFQDKYEILEWIFHEDIADKADEWIDDGHFFKALYSLVSGLEKEKNFYRKAFRIEGANSFRDILTDYIYQTFLKVCLDNRSRRSMTMPYLTSQRVARYYMHGLVNIIEDWLFDDNCCTAEELCESYKYLLFHSVQDTILENQS